MTGAPLAKAMTAARALAAQRTGNQELGVITFDETAYVTLPLTSDPQSINAALAATPSIGPGTRILPALTLALEQLSSGAHRRRCGDSPLRRRRRGEGDQAHPSVRGRRRPARKASPSSPWVSRTATSAPVRCRSSRAGGESSSRVPAFSSHRSSPASRPVCPAAISCAIARPFPRDKPISVSAQVAGSPGTVNVSYVAPAPPPVAAKPAGARRAGWSESDRNAGADGAAELRAGNSATGAARAPSHSGALRSASLWWRAFARCSSALRWRSC